jgi:hypothetical protein
MYTTLLLVQRLYSGSSGFDFQSGLFLTVFFCGFSKAAKADAGTFPQTGHDRFIPNPFQ